MIRAHDLLLFDPAHRKFASMPEMDPLTEEDALQEAQALDVRIDLVSGVVGVIFDLRQALQLRQANTGVLVAGGIHDVAWSGRALDKALTAWSVGSSVPRPKNRLFSLNIIMWPHPGARLLLTSEKAAFFVGNDHGLSAAPPDFSEGDRGMVGQAVASWDSSLELVSAVFLDPAPLARD